MKKVLLVIIAVIILILLASIIWVKYIPANTVSFLKSDSGIGKVLCKYPFKIQGSSMEPEIVEGETVTFSKCFEKDELSVGIYVVFRDRNYTRVGKIREIQDNDENVIYKVSQNARPEDVFEVSPSDIVAVNEQL